jgi:hypothetical protein
MAVTNNDNNKITSAGEDVEKKGAPMNCWWECKFAQPLWQKIWWFHKKAKSRTIMQSSYATLGYTYISEGHEVSIENRYLQAYVYCSTIHSTWDMELAEVPINRWMD